MNQILIFFNDLDIRNHLNKLNFFELYSYFLSMNHYFYYTFVENIKTLINHKKIIFIFIKLHLNRFYLNYTELKNVF
jgi:hypothetical protein